MNIGELSQRLGGKLVSSGRKVEHLIPAGLASLKEARSDQLSFLARDEFLEQARSSKAMGLIVKKAIEGFSGFQIEVPDAYLAFAKAAAIYAPPEEIAPPEGRSLSYIHPEALLGEGVEVFPHVYIGRGAKVGKGSRLFPGVYLGPQTEVGEASTLYAGVVVYQGCRIGSRVIIHAKAVIGADGFGYAIHAGASVKIPQTGIAVIEDDVEIGPGCTVDRATLGQTVIGKGTKLDSQVHVAHNSKLGSDCRFSALTGVAGSAEIGSRVVTGGQVGISGHIQVGDDTTFAAKSGVTKSIREAGTYAGFPAIPANQWRRQQVRLRQLDALEGRLRELEAKLKTAGI